jgi:calcium/calmodulin-dependent protein kinase (CaM kinase) II
MPSSAEDELLALTQQLLDSIASADWKTYDALCDGSLSAFEPEGRGHLIEGMDFHRFYFNLGAGDSPRNTTMSQPKVRLLGDVAIVAYVRLVQSLCDGSPVTSHYEETRVWQRQAGKWKHVHFHRSRCE